MALNGKTEIQKFEDLCTRSYKQQATWLLNTFWLDFAQKEADKIWGYSHKMAELDHEKGKDGCELDELQAHRFVEAFHETLSVVDMRKKLREAGVDKNTRAKYIPLSHFYVYHYNANWKRLANFEIGDQQEIIKAQKLLEEVTALFVTVQKEEAEARLAERAAKQAKVELEEALAELKKQEDAYNHKKDDLTKRSETGGMVSRNKAKAELAQHLNEDPLPLRRAKINQEAAVRKAEKAAKEAEIQRAEAEAALAAATRKVAEAEAYLEEVRKRPGVAYGDLWWIEKELAEQKKYLPQRKGGVAK